jgi:uncharacterized protein (TIGR02452 family)
MRSSQAYSAGPSDSTSITSRSSSKSTRTKSAKHILHTKVPALLVSDALAREGVHSSKLLKDLPPFPGPSGSSKTPAAGSINPASVVKVEVWHTDTITAALRVHSSIGISTGTSTGSTNASTRLAILNMASPLRPGGGVLTGATSQEEFLCTRTTLYPSLHESFYRIPETGLIYTRDVLIFADALGEDLPTQKEKRVYIDVVSAAMLRFPEVVTVINEEETKWAEEKDRELALTKMRMVMRALVMHGVTHVVLGAWGCGAYANPTKEIAKCWKLVLLGNKKGLKECWASRGLQSAVFAITSKKQTEVFGKAFGVNVEIDDLRGIKIP